MCMFVRLVKRNNNRVSIQIVENNRFGDKVKQKVILHMGQFDKDDTKEIDFQKELAEKIIIEKKNRINPTFPGFEYTHAPKKRVKKEESNKDNNGSKDAVSISGLREEQRLHIGVKDIFGSIYDNLFLLDPIETGYKKNDSNRILKEIVLSRINAPSSKRKSVELIERDKNIPMDLDKVYRMMDKVYKNEERIREKICDSTKKLLKTDIDLLFFDVTTLYFESFQPDELRVSGFSKDNKVKETQVVLALMTTTEGLPVGYKLFPGNTYEGHTLMKVIEETEEQYEISNTFIVADRAMFTSANLENLEKKKAKFIIAAKLKGMKKEYREPILTDVADIIRENDIKKDIVVKKGNKAKYFTWTGEYEYGGNRLIVSYSQKRADKDKKDRQRLVDRIQKKMKNGKVLLKDLIHNRGSKKYLKIDRKNSATAELNEAKIKEDERWDGIHGVISNQESSGISAEQILEKYRGLWQIEAAFRINKHDLKMRPVYHWTPKRIKAHILICFIAYSVASFARYRLKQANLKLSLERIREELSRVQVSVVKDKVTGKRFLMPSRLDPIQHQIYKALDIKIDQTIKRIE